MLRRYAIIFVLLLVVSTISGQEVILRGRVLDAVSNQPIEKVNLLVKDTHTGASTSMEGYFELTVSSLPVTLLVSHISYEQKTVVIKDNMAIDRIKILLYPRINLLKEALVTSHHKFVSAGNVITVMDFNFLDENILILLFNHTRNTHELVLTGPFFDTIACSGKFTDKNRPQYLFRDCLGECHVYDKYFDRQVIVEDSIIRLEYIVTSGKFHETLDDCLFQTSDYVVFEKHLNDYYQEFYCLHKETSEKRIILSADEMKKASALNEEINFILSHPELFGDIGAQIRFEREIMFRPAYKIMANIGDSVYYFNHLSASIDIFNDGLWYLKSVPIAYHKQKNWQREILVDPIEGKAYTTFLHGGKYDLHEINLEDGTISYVMTIPFAFPYKIMVNNGFLYVLYRNLASSWDKKSLYWIRL